MNRNLRLDNTKFILILLVVFGHMIEPMIRENAITKSLYLFVYSFHIPAFALISGLVTKNIFDKSYINKNFSNLFVVFIIFTLLYEINHYLITDNFSLRTINLEPYYVLWFLYSLFLWRILLLIFMCIRYPIIFSILLSILSGYVEIIDYYLGLSRTIYFFPFFLIGYVYKNCILDEKYLSYIPITIAVIVFCFILLFFYQNNSMSHQLLWGWSYGKLGLVNWLDGVIRVFLYVVAMVSTICLLVLVPNKPTFMTQLGNNSLYCYLWHGFIIKYLLSVELFTIFQNINVFIVLIIIGIFSFFIVYVLSQVFISNFTNKYIIEPVKKIVVK